MTTVEEFDSLAAELSNWGRWGAEDQRGTLNFITPETVKKAAASVVSGEVFSLGMDLRFDGAQDGSPPRGRVNPVLTMIGINTPMSDSPNSARYTDDVVFTAVQAATHWDALSHTSYRGVMYNGISADTIDAVGAHKLGIEAAGEVASRGILLDVARHEGVDVLPGRFAVTRTVLEEVEAAQESPVEEGDILVVRTGQASFFLEGNVPRYRRPVPAFDYDAAQFFHDRRIAAVAIDIAPFELIPANVEELILPLHVLNLVYQGLLQGQNWVLEDLAAACAKDRRYAFQLAATAERFLHSPSGMVNPIAIR